MNDIKAQPEGELLSLLLEIGTEDIPARFITLGMEQLDKNSRLILKENHIKFTDVKTYGTPRRLAIIIGGIPQLQEDRIKEVFGPSKKAAFDEKGNPTKAAFGFAGSQGIPIEKLIVKNKDKGEYVVAVIEEKGVHVKELLPQILEKIVLSLHFPKAMRWGNNNTRFVRPIRWLLALFDKEPVSFEIDGIKSGNITKGHRFLSPATFRINDIQSYKRMLAINHVVVDPDERKKIISDKIQEIAASVKGSPVEDQALIDTVTHLVEYPVPVLGSFSKEYLKLPKELLITVMKEHQKYFAIQNSEGSLANYFIIVSNTNIENSETVKIGAERVIKARFEDARFYFEEDGKKKLQDRIDDLKNVTYQEKLGSLYDKIQRIKALSAFLAKKINPSLTEKTERAALISKTDLITGVVREFPELQGIIGRYYAINDNEASEVAEALMEQYQPGHQGDRLPETEVGSLLSLADKIDNIVSFFSIGLMPTGSEDPFALRRQTLAAISIMLNKGYDIPLNNIISEAFKPLKNIKAASNPRDSVLQFFEQRIEYLFSTRGYASDVIQAAIPYAFEIPLKELTKRLDAINEFKTLETYNDFLTAIKRVKNIIPKTDLPSLKKTLLSGEPEKRLSKDLKTAKTSFEQDLQEQKYLDALKTLSGLTGSINHFFDNVLVMDKQEEIKLNRLALLKDVWTTASAIADFSKL